MKDIMWRSTSEFKDNISKLEFTHMIILVHGKDETYETKLIYKDGVEMWEDAPLGNFSCPKFNPFSYEKIAIVDYQ